jgi:hypothetical protein
MNGIFLDLKKLRQSTTVDVYLMAERNWGNNQVLSHGRRPVFDIQEGSQNGEEFEKTR